MDLADLLKRKQDEFRQYRQDEPQWFKKILQGLGGAAIIIGFATFLFLTFSQEPNNPPPHYAPQIHEEFRSGIPEHLVCWNTTNRNVIVDEVYPQGVWLTGFPYMIKGLTPDGKRKWSTIAGDLFCEDTEM